MIKPRSFPSRALKAPPGPLRCCARRCHFGCRISGFNRISEFEFLISVLVSSTKSPNFLW